MGATLRQVAHEAGVSVATASRAFTKPDLVGERTRERILDIAARLDYAPNLAARALNTGRTQSVGIVVPDLMNPFYPSIVTGARRRASALGYSLLIADSEEDPAAELPILEEMARKVDGILLCSSRMGADSLARAQELGPLVLLNRRLAGVPSVSFDSTAAVQTAALHLRVMGHRRVAYVGGPASSTSNVERRDRIGQFFPPQGLEVVQVGDFEPSVDGGRAAADGVLSAGASAVLVYNDVMALGLMGRLIGYGLAIPRDLSVIGWDDIQFAELVTPALTTVRVPRERAGEEAMAYLDAVIRRGGPGEDRLLSTEFVFRSTTGRARPNQAPATPDADHPTKEST